MIENHLGIVSKIQASEYALKHFNIKGKARKISGEVDFNYYIKDDKKGEFLIKISRPKSSIEEIEFQSAIIKHLVSTGFPIDIPTIVLTTNGEEHVELEDNQYIRLQKWIPGRMLSEVDPRSENLCEMWGKTCGLLSSHLQGFDHPCAHRFYKWNPSEVLHTRKFREYVRNDEEKQILEYFWRLFEDRALPYLNGLRKSVNYNDAHEHNLLVSENYINPEIRGVIDFGDALYCETINELAIACAYAGMYHPDPIRNMSYVVKGYNSKFPLEEKELYVLYSLVCARLVITVANAAYNKHHEPDNEYLLISEKPAWDLLNKLRTISPDLAHFTFRNVCGLEPCARRILYNKWIKENGEEIKQIVEYSNSKIASLDLSIESLDLGNNSNFSDIHIFTKTISRMLEDKGVNFGIGGYGEVRAFYSTDSYQTTGNSGTRWRTTHLGVDIWGEDGTDIIAPLDGIVHSLQDNEGDRDYGPTIILKHTVTQDLTFFTLYGHLNEECLETLKVGQSISRGQKIAEIGAPPINGNWPPHVHFQVILDLLGNHGDFPGVAFPEESDVWLSICPDGEKFTYPDQYESKKEKQVSKTDILSIRNKNLGKSLSISYENPLHMVRGYMQYLYDTDGRRYLDTVNNVAHVGHEHPRVVEAGQRQMAVLNTNTRYLHKNIVTFTEELLSTFPSELCVVHIVNSGSEANELALRMVKAYTGQSDIIAVEAGYHGNTGACIGISSYKFDGKGGKGAPKGTYVVPMPDVFRGLYKNDDQAGPKYAQHLKNVIEEIQSQGRNIGGFICESILSCGGQIALPENYLKEAYSYIRKAGGLCIADEVQVGCGRVGEKYWGFELQEVVPDIVTIGKPIGNGHPLAVVVTTRKVADAFANGMEYFNTFGGNPVSCAIGNEVLNVIKDEGLQANAYEVGSYLKSGLNDLKMQHQIIGDVRGHGLFLGFEMVKDLETLLPASSEASYLVNRMRQLGILMSTDGPFENVIKIKPPMCFNKSNADFLLETLQGVLSEDFIKYSIKK